MGLSEQYWSFISNAVYVFLALDALWGAYCIIVIFMRITQKRFRSERAQNEFLDTVEVAVKKGDFDTAVMQCEGDRRAVPQLAAQAVQNRNLPVEEIQELLVDRFQRDVISDLEHRVNWTNNVIKTAPMLGLLGTVLGMMAAFAKISSKEGSAIDPTELSRDISFALITTAIGLAIAIPATACVASINIRIRKLEDQVSAGVVRLLEIVSSVQRQQFRSR